MGRKALVFVCVVSLLLPGCATMDLEWPEKEPNLIAVSYSIADALIERLKIRPLPFSPILVASFVESGKTERTTNFGRMMGDFIGSRMSMNGFKVVEIRAGEQIRLVRDSGDLLLAREAAEPATPAKVQAIVSGSYTKSNQGIYVSARMLRADNQQIISSVDLHLPLSYELMLLL